MKTITLASGERVPALGIGTWRMGESRTARAEEIATLRLAIDLGAALIDTAEMYGDGGAEALVGEAIADRRERVFLVSKVYPHHASRKGTRIACEQSLKRLRTDRLDLYLLHWRGDVPLRETLDAFEELEQQGKIRYFGVSNFAPSDLRELDGLSGARAVATNQVLYNLARRGVEWDLLPFMHARHMPLMAYSPLEQGRLVRHRGLAEFARRHGMTPAQAALAWVVSHEGVFAVVKSGNRRRLEENIGALDHPLSSRELLELDRLFPPPTGASPLAML